jgi:hypothetical protein
LSESDLPEADGRLLVLARLLGDAPGITAYTEIFPRLSPGHLLSLTDGRRTLPIDAADQLTLAGRLGPSDADTAVRVYRERGEIPALRQVADPETVALATMEWQREIDQRLGVAEARAALWDGEGVRCEADLTWAKRVRQLRERVAAEYSDSPGSQNTLVSEYLREMDDGLKEEKQNLHRRLKKLSEDLEKNRHAMEEDAYSRAEEDAVGISKQIDNNNLILALRKLASLEALVGGRAVRLADGVRQRLPRPVRHNPIVRSGFHFEDMISIARQGAEGVARRHLEDFLPDPNTIEETANVSGFLARHATKRVPDWNSYFGALREWLGLSEARRTSRRGRRLQRLEMPNLEPKGAKLPGRWTFLTAEPWEGTPFLEDIAGRPRILAIVRLAVDDADRNRLPVILKFTSQTLRELLVTQSAEVSDERRFRQDGLVIVLLPGDILSGKKYDQFCRSVQFEKSSRLAGRIAYLDDLDLLRLLPVPTDDRFRALLELSLPRFPDSLSQTYQNSDAVRSRMFFGRRDELARLENGATVVFSGRKMGKSSLLHRLRGECSGDTGRRAVMVGCSAIASGRSWLVLKEIEREMIELLRRESPEKIESAGNFAPGLFDDPVEAMRVAKERFRIVLDDVIQRLEGLGVTQLYILLDEADNFVRAELEETSGGKDPRSAVSWFLRDLQTSIFHGRLRFIFAGYDQIGRIFRDPGLGHSAFGNWGEQPLKLGPLDEGDARELIVKPLTALGMTVGDDLVERILDYTSGHASLIQAFCRKLAERVRETQPAWPLDDVAVRFEHIQEVADDQRGAGDQNYRQLLEQTLGLNLDIARAYPLNLIFLALASPRGLGSGRVLGSDGFTFEEALDQVRPFEGDLMDELAPTLVLDSLDLLAQLGLLEDVSDNRGRAYTFKARHYVNVLRTKNGFRAQLQQVMEEWQRSGRRSNHVEPRYVWTLADSDLRTMRQRDSNPRPAVVVGLPGTGRGYLANMLASPFTDGQDPVLMHADDPGFSAHLDDLLTTKSSPLIIVHDPRDSIAWGELTGWLSRFREVHVPLRWVGGPRLAWELAGDLEVALLIDGPFRLGPLTVAEIEPWTARTLGGEGPPSAASISDADREPFLRLTGGLLPVLEQFRTWLLLTHGQFPDPLRLSHAQEFLRDLMERPAKAERAAELLATDLPAELRIGLHHLFLETREWGETLPSLDLAEFSPYLKTLGDEPTGRLLDAAHWLGLLPDCRVAGQVIVPHDSILGFLIRQPRFAVP